MLFSKPAKTSAEKCCTVFFFFLESQTYLLWTCRFRVSGETLGASRMEGFMHAMISICFLMFCNSFRHFALNQTSAPIHVPSRRKCTGSQTDAQDAGVQKGKKRERQRTVATLSEKNLMSGCGRLPQPEWFSQTHLKKTEPHVRAYLRSADTRA